MKSLVAFPSACFAATLTVCILAGSSFDRPIDKEEAKKEILRTEREFQKMTVEKGVTEAFYHFADENAVILRENDTLIKGRENIRMYYGKKNLSDASVDWAPDYIEVSKCGTLAYTYGNYVWKVKKENGETAEYKGVFHTVWKRQKDKSWKYVWD